MLYHVTRPRANIREAEVGTVMHGHFTDLCLHSSQEEPRQDSDGLGASTSPSAKQRSLHKAQPLRVRMKLESLTNCTQQTLLPNCNSLCSHQTETRETQGHRDQMLGATFSKGLQLLAFAIFWGSSFCMYRIMCTHHSRHTQS